MISLSLPPEAALCGLLLLVLARVAVRHRIRFPFQQLWSSSMFNLTPSETFKETVKIQVKTESGSWREESFTAIFQRSDEERRQELHNKPFAEVVDEFLVGWEMKDLQRLPVEFTPDNKAAFMRLPAAVRETAITYLRTNAGAKEKN
ncbi:hypothetical protein [Delftia tsuruhatensis]|uniref:hypothetical protein n=1 Tax=Delftia tsuruhatensis TaxID=180282 RepID=UPI0031D98B6F